ncbi:MAG: nucleotidyltransferase domain-containing protein [Bacteroidia bacterium]|nr:nucleotidyltransferase domain-containing protein [Bacteroidia bacterium]
MNEKIKNTLLQIEVEKNLKILYACETGSRAWGFPSPDSDYDVRIIYMHEPDWYLTLSDKHDTIDMMLDEGELDISGWDFKKCLKLLWKSNGALLERIQSPIVYKNTEGLTEEFKKYADLCFAPVAAMHHYLGMAKNTFYEVDVTDSAKLKKLFYALRATLACKWIEERNSIPPIVFMTMVNELAFDESLKTRIKELVGLKSRENESYLHPEEKELNMFIREHLKHFSEIADSIAGGQNKQVDLDVYFRYGLKNYWS